MVIRLSVPCFRGTLPYLTLPGEVHSQIVGSTGLQRSTKVAGQYIRLCFTAFELLGVPGFH